MSYNADKIANTAARSKAFRIWSVIVLLIGCTTWLISRNANSRPAPQNECDFIKEQYKQAMNMIYETRKDVHAEPTSFIWENTNPISFASFTDTLKPTPRQKILTKLDSFILEQRRKMDSLERKKQ